ncbi:fluoride efflux transporter FluC [Corynebacterium uterequi]|uniref:Fluoride-specific ion channel FluC n=1 Tax=Corynebacterium uterequi TaxID=1072256 RepID=A0A0G3HEL7_9CORY|nr:CrcB family protein [Corynebacterium uterequi]AKK11786.1 putative membrane protein [Corynebacterium uterequi]
MIGSAVLVAVGGFFGGFTRWWLTRQQPSRRAILLSNVGASLLLGGLTGAEVHGWCYLLLGVGLSGALSTWSTFAAQVVELWVDRHRRRAVAYAASTLGASVLAAAGGMVAGGAVG